MKRYLLLIASLAMVGFSSCSNDKKPGKPDDGKISNWGFFLRGTEQLANSYSIVDESLKPIAKANVLIGNKINSPFTNNYIQTNESGQFIIPSSWTSAQNLTIDAPGYVRVTFLNEMPKVRQIILKKMASLPAREVTGITTGHQIKDKDGFIDFSLVMSAMSRTDLLNLDLNKVISTQNDKITVAGQDVLIPSNVSLPKQKESYYIGVTLEKPQYRLYFDQPGVQRVYAARGRFPFKDVVGRMRDKAEFFELINYFNITGGTVKDIQVTENSTKLDINVTDLNYTQKLNVQAPSFAADQIMIALSAADMNGYLIPTDVKRLVSKEKMPLAILAGQTSFVAHVLKRASEFKEGPGSDRLSGVLLPFTDNSQAEFLSLIENPKAISASSFQFQIPTHPAAVAPMATYALLSNVDPATKTVTRTWEVYSKNWESQIELPEWPQAMAATNKRIEVSFIGSLNSTETDLGPQLIEKATHVTRSSVDY